MKKESILKRDNGVNLGSDEKAFLGVQQPARRAWAMGSPSHSKVFTPWLAFISASQPDNTRDTTTLNSATQSWSLQGRVFVIVVVVVFFLVAGVSPFSGFVFLHKNAIALVLFSCRHVMLHSSM